MWLVGQGWVRVDPTASVAPERVERGLAEILGRQQGFFSGSILSLAKYQQMPWLNALRIKLANIDYYWSRWLLGYNKDKQFQLLELLLGSFNQIKLIAFTLCCFTVVAVWLLFAGGFRFKRLTPLQLVDKSYGQLISAFESVGVIRQKHMTPTHYQQLVIEHYPATTHEIIELTQHYNQLKFRQHDVVTRQDVIAFRTLIKVLLNKI